FSDGSVLPLESDGVYAFVVRQDRRAEVTYTVDGLIGGGHLLGGGTQGFVSRRPDGTVRFLPYDYSRPADAWFCNTGSRTDQGWVIIRPDMAMAECGDFPPVRVLGTYPRFANCQSCHGSQIGAALEPGVGVETEWESLSVNCETCHGPGRAHLEWAADPGRGTDIGMESRVVDGVDQSLQVCFQCHALKDVVTEGHLSGMPLEEYYALKLPVLGDEPYVVDGRVATFGYQGTHLSSSCYLDGSMTCVSCHEPHGQGYWDINRAPLTSEVDDGQCTACHGAKATDPEAHSGHPPSAEVTCVACHMPYLQHPEVGDEIPFGRSDHTIPVPRPRHDQRMGLVSACRTCHEERSEISLQASVEEMWGLLKPHDPIVSGLLAVTPGLGTEQAGRLLLHPQLERSMAQFQALARFLSDWTSPNDTLPVDTRTLLTSLAASEDIDVRSLAWATLHWTGDESAAGRATLEPAAVRRRWGMILSYLGDEAGSRGDVPSAEAGYRKALEVLPEDPGVLRSLGLLYNQTGDFGRAIDAFTRALEGDPDQPLTYVNLGVAFAGSGDAAGALRSYQSALRIDPNEPLAHFNIGNVHLRAGAWNQAIQAYGQALAYEPGLGLGHFNLAVALIRAERYQEALPHARMAREFLPGDGRPEQMVADLEQVLGGSP
ncbi:MAG: ammonia-forming cytochrome c nitrite reductase subunit c552, partial [Gemmatimonadetes bacterium]|nr:ammonia-forming cytochrome c nitrite reductase subunit c552 [Gemmatimonadota bacterium]